MSYGGNAGFDEDGKLTESPVLSFAPDGGIKGKTGTSFSTPRVTAIAAGLQMKMGESFNPLLAKALIIHSAHYPTEMKMEIGDKTINGLIFKARIDKELCVTRTLFECSVFVVNGFQSSCRSRSDCNDTTAIFLCFIDRRLSLTKMWLMLATRGNRISHFGRFVNHGNSRFLLSFYPDFPPITHRVAHPQSRQPLTAKNPGACAPGKNGADYGARTRHLDLGKVALYQMS